jgi:type II secretory pathway component PulF
MCKETNYKDFFEWPVAKFFLNGQVFAHFCKDLIIITQSKLTLKEILETCSNTKPISWQIDE